VYLYAAGVPLIRSLVPNVATVGILLLVATIILGSRRTLRGSAYPRSLDTF
jgi:hypothetical protein